MVSPGVTNVQLPEKLTGLNDLTHMSDGWCCPLSGPSTPHGIEVARG